MLCQRLEARRGMPVPRRNGGLFPGSGPSINHNTLIMDHIKIQFAEPIVGIQRVRNEVFLGEDNTLWILSLKVYKEIERILRVDYKVDVHLRSRHRGNGIYYKLVLGSGYTFFASDLDEIFVMRGEERIWVENELGDEIALISHLEDCVIDDNAESCK